MPNFNARAVLVYEPPADARMAVLLQRISNIPCVGVYDKFPACSVLALSEQ